MRRIFMFIVACAVVCALAGQLFAPPAGFTSAPSVEQLKPLAGLLTHRAEALITAFFRDSLDWTVTVCWADRPGSR